jgi:tetratricopeptide (TPR) repeat protein
MTNRKSSFFPSAFILTACALVAVPAMAQQDHGGGAGESAAELPESFSEPMPLFETALGDHHHAISSDNEQAQAWFDQGFRLMYAFGKEDAVRSFREAWKHDPDCAICYWGEAWAWGSYLNGPMRPPEAPHAYAALRKAMALAADGHGTARERDYIDALSVRYVESFDVAKRREQDEAYAEAMKALSERYPDDLDAAALYGDALFLLEPRRGTRDLDDPNVQRLHGVLEGVLARDIEHPGACHLYIHATESTVEPGKAEACAEHLGTAIPGASHINHMPSHTWNEVGRWADGVRANLRAWHSDLKAADGGGEGIAIYPTHNLHMLLFAASMDGQGAIAVQAARDYGKIVPGGAFYEAMTLLRFGRFDEILELDEPPAGGIQRGFWDFARGYAYLRRDEPGRASIYLEKVQRAAEKIPDNERFRGHSAVDLLGVVAGILEGEILRHEGNPDKAIEVLEAAIEREDGLRYDEPEPLNFSARHWLGDLLLESERYGEAETVFRAALEDHPMNGWSLFGLEAALRAQGKDAKADEVRPLFLDAWARSDTWITGPIFQ